MTGMETTGRIGSWSRNENRVLTAERVSLVSVFRWPDTRRSPTSRHDRRQFEPHRFFRRLQLLSRMEHHEQDDEPVFP